MNKIVTTQQNHKLASILRRSLAVAAFCLVTFHSPAQAQNTDRQRLMAVMTVINMMLLDRDPPIARPTGFGIELDLNQFDEGTYTTSENVFAEFALQDDLVELCFFVDSAQIIEDGDLMVEINGESQAAYFGENCFSITEPEQRSVNYVNLIVNRAGLSVQVSTFELQASNQSQLQLPTLTRGQWNERAVRKVLKVFAFGGHATDQQIFIWAAMKPELAIQEMLNFDEHNLLLSPLAPNEQFDDSATALGKLWDWQVFLRDESSNYPIPADARNQYGFDGYNFDDGYGRMITVRGLNPFRQRIGFWETNYHLAVNRNAGVSREEVSAYYDLIMEAHEAGLPYHQVMGVAAKSAAIAEQYGHDRNQWRYDRNLDEYYCACNDDFAREIHQLFYGIFGDADPEHHESVTIPNTARMLTDMPINDEDSTPEQVRVNFGTERHYSGANGEPPLSILNYLIPHSDSADQKIDYLMPLSIQHPESLENLPIMVIEGLADNNLSEQKKAQLRSSWASMGVNRVLLDFIHAYAISDLFHSPDQLRYFTSHERALFLANKNNLDNFEAYSGGYRNWAGRSVGGPINDDNAGQFFEPLHNVFGGQSPLEAADSALAFENNYNQLTEYEYNMRDIVYCSECNNGQPWEKRWQDVLPQRADGQYYVSDVAEWLWVHVTGSLDHYTELERAQMYSLLGAVRRAPGQSYDQDHALDFNLLMCKVNDYLRETEEPYDLSIDNILDNVIHEHCTYYRSGPDFYDPDEIEDINAVYTGQDIADNPVMQQILAQLGEQTLPLTSENLTNSDDLRHHAKERVNNTLAFIFTTPFVFAEAQ